jgi:hypothetical protein
MTLPSTALSAIGDAFSPNAGPSSIREKFVAGSRETLDEDERDPAAASMVRLDSFENVLIFAHVVSLLTDLRLDEPVLGQQLEMLEHDVRVDARQLDLSGELVRRRLLDFEKERASDLRIEFHKLRLQPDELGSTVTYRRASRPWSLSLLNA